MRNLVGGSDSQGTASSPQSALQWEQSKEPKERNLVLVQKNGVRIKEE